MSENLRPAGLLLHISLLECLRWRPTWGAGVGPAESFFTKISSPFTLFSQVTATFGENSAVVGLTVCVESTTGVVVPITAAAAEVTAPNRFEMLLAVPSSLESPESLLLQGKGSEFFFALLSESSSDASDEEQLGNFLTNCLLVNLHRTGPAWIGDTPSVAGRSAASAAAAVVEGGILHGAGL